MQIGLIGSVALFIPGDAGPQRIETAVNVAIPPIDLLDVLDRAAPFGAHRRNEQRHAGTDIGRRHPRGPQPNAVVVPDDRFPEKVQGD